MSDNPIPLRNTDWMITDLAEEVESLLRSERYGKISVAAVLGVLEECKFRMLNEIYNDDGG